MPITRKSKNLAIAGTPNQPAVPIADSRPQELSRGRMYGAGLVRGGSGLAGSLLANGLGLGNVAAFGIGGAGDLLAQAIEEGDYNPLHQLDAPSLKRAAIEGAITATPGKWLMVPGKALKTAVRSGVLGGVGEYGREKARGEEANPKSIVKSGVIGAAFGGLLSKIFPGKSTSAPKPSASVTVDDLVAQHAGDTAAFAKALPGLMHKEGWKGNLDRILEEATKLEKAGNPEHAQVIREVGLSTGYWDPKTVASEIERLVALGDEEGAQALRIAAAKTRRGTIGVSTKAGRVRAQKAKEEDKLAKAVEAKRRTEELLKTGKTSPSASRKIAGVDPETGETITYTETIKPKKQRKGPITDVSGTSPIAPIAPAGGPAAPIIPPAKPGIWQLIDEETGNVKFEAKTEQEAADFINNPVRIALAEQGMTPKIHVVPPSDLSPSVAPIQGPPGLPSPPKSPTAPVTATTKAPALIGKIPEVSPTQPSKLMETSGMLPVAPSAPVEPSIEPILSEQAKRNAIAKAEAASEGPGIPKAVIDAGPPLALEQPIVPQEPVPTSPKKPTQVGSGTPRAVDVPVVETSGQPTKPLMQDKSGKVDYRQVLTDQEAQDIYERIMRERYAEINAPDAAEEMIAATKAYRTAKAAGSPEANALGKEVGRTIPSRHVEGGKVPVGFAKQVSDDIKAALQAAGEEKLAASVKIGTPPVSPYIPVRSGEPLPEIGSGLKWNDPPPTGVSDVDVTNIPKEPPSLVTEDMLPNHIVKRIKELQSGIDSGDIPTDMATRMRTKLDEEIKKYLESKGSNGPVLGSGFGALEALRNNPQLAIKAGLISGGALLGAAAGPTGDPIVDMIIGGTAGMTGAKAIGMLRRANIDPNDIPELGSQFGASKTITDKISSAIHLVPHFQRANYLWSAEGLGANAVAGPYGAGFFGALTKGLSGDPRGWAALREFAPWNAGNWVKEYKASYAEAIDLIQRVEAGDPLARAEIGGATIHQLLSGGSKTQVAMRGYLGFPAWTMAAGDLATRRILIRNGFTEDEARVMTLTAEPMLPSFQKLMNLRRGKPAPLLETMFPFVRTPLNILEQGILRTPGIGFLAHSAVERQGAIPAALAEKVAQQGLGAVIGSSAYVIGLMAPKEQAPTLRRYLSNSAGQYSMLAAIGFAAGQGARRTEGGPISGMLSPEAIRQLGYSFPVPAAEPITNLLTTAGQIYNGRPISMPAGVIPQQVKDIQRYLKVPEPATSLSIKGLGGIKRKIK